MPTNVSVHSSYCLLSLRVVSRCWLSRMFSPRSVWATINIRPGRDIPTVTSARPLVAIIFSIHIDEFIEREDGLAKIGQGKLLRVDFWVALIAYQTLANLRVNEVFSRLHFVTRWFPTQCQPPSQPDLPFRLQAGLRPHSAGEIECTSAHKFVIQQRQSLGGDRCVFATTATRLRIRSVEGLHERMLDHSFVKHVNTAAARGRGVLHVLRIWFLHIARLDGFV